MTSNSELVKAGWVPVRPVGKVDAERAWGGISRSSPEEYVRARAALVKRWEDDDDMSLAQLRDDLDECGLLRSSDDWWWEVRRYASKLKTTAEWERAPVAAALELARVEYRRQCVRERVAPDPLVLS